MMTRMEYLRNRCGSIIDQDRHFVRVEVKAVQRSGRRFLTAVTSPPSKIAGGSPYLAWPSGIPSAPDAFARSETPVRDRPDQGWDGDPDHIPMSSDMT
jgi:hypothetical protein